jgi:hypothetical protein
MTTSGTYVFTVTRDDVIRQAMLNIGKLDAEESPKPQDTTDCSRVLNMMCKQWQAKSDFAAGLKVWTRRRGYLFLNNSSGQYTLGPGGIGWTLSPLFTATTSNTIATATTISVPASLSIAAADNIGIVMDSGAIFWTTVVSYIGTTITLTTAIKGSAASGSIVYAYTNAATQPITIETAILRDSTNNDVPVRIIRDVQTYDLLPQKANPQNSSDPGAIYYEFQLTNSNLYTDVGAAQDVTKYLVITYMEAIQDFNNPLDNPEYPQEWFLAISWGLAKEIAPMYNAPWTPLMTDNFTRALAIAQKKDPEVRTDYFTLEE